MRRPPHISLLAGVNIYVSQAILAVGLAIELDYII